MSNHEERAEPPANQQMSHRIIKMKHFTTLVLLLATLLLVGCADSINATPTGVSGDLRLTLTTEPSPALRQQQTILRVEVRDGAGNPVEGARVELSTRMIGMSHGGIKGTLADKGKGIYEGAGEFIMGGTWRVEVIASRGGGSPTTGNFDIEVK